MNIQETLTKHALWRKQEEGGERADLSGADLYRANLSGADLSGADLSGADLSGADLSKADLSKADLSKADLSGADLSGADLYRADLYRADLSKANLFRANLSGAKDVFQFGPMPTSGRICIAIRHPEGWKVSAGCFFDYLPVLEERVKRSHNCHVYLGMIELLKNM